MLGASFGSMRSVRSVARIPVERDVEHNVLSAGKDKTTMRLNLVLSAAKWGQLVRESSRASVVVWMLLKIAGSMCVHSDVLGSVSIFMSHLDEFGNRISGISILLPV